MIIILVICIIIIKELVIIVIEKKNFHKNRERKIWFKPCLFCKLANINIRKYFLN